MTTVNENYKCQTRFGMIAALCLLLFIAISQPAQALVDYDSDESCSSQFPGMQWICDLGLAGSTRGSVVFNDGSSHYTYVFQEEFNDVTFIDDVNEELTSSRYNDHAEYALRLKTDKRGGLVCDAVCGSRACLGMSTPTSLNSDQMFNELAGLTEFPNQVQCSVVGESAFRAFLDAQSYARAMLEGGSANARDAMVIPMILDAYAILALSQEIGYDANLVKMVHQARKIRGFKMGVQYYTADAIELAAQEAYDRFNRRTYTAHLISYKDPDDEDTFWYCPHEKNPPSGPEDYEAGKYYCVDEMILELRPTTYSQLIGFLQPPDLFANGPYTYAKFSDASWRRSGSDGYLMPRKNHMTDQQLLNLAIELSESVVLEADEIMKSQVYMGQVATYDAHQLRPGDPGYIETLPVCPTSVDDGVFQRTAATEMNIPDWLLHFNRYRAEYGDDITDPFFQKMTIEIQDVLNSCDVEPAPGDCRMP